MRNINIESEDEKRLRAELATRQDPDSKRMQRFLDMPDLSRTPDSPLYEVVQRALRAKSLADFDVIKIPEIVPTNVTFDLFNMGPDHPARSTSDTYYVDEKNILRTHDTVFWYYYFNQPEIRQKIVNKETFGVVCYGKVYRKDEIDNRHMNVFHQFGGGFMAPMTPEEMADKKASGEKWGKILQDALTDIAQTVFAPVQVTARFNPDDFPYTDPSYEIEVQIGDSDRWIELLGCGVPRESVLKNMGVEGYTGWWFGFGLDRLAIVSMALPDIRLLRSADPRVKNQLKLGQQYKEVSKYPPITRDISFVVKKGFVPNEYFDLIRDIVGDMAEEVKLLDHHEDEAKFGPDRESYTYRVVYRSTERTLTKEEVDILQKKLVEESVARFGAEIR